MIIVCPKCKKKFEINDTLIPKKGRLLQCSSCENKWFFKKEIKIKRNIERISSKPKIEEIPKETENLIIEAEKNKINQKKKKSTNLPILNMLLVLLVSFIALIIILDTFKFQIQALFPNFEFLLENFYETLRDFYLFIIDLFN